MYGLQRSWEDSEYWPKYCLLKHLDINKLGDIVAELLGREKDQTNSDYYKGEYYEEEDFSYINNG